MDTSKDTDLIHFSKSQSWDLNPDSQTLEHLPGFIVLLQASLTTIQQETRLDSSQWTLYQLWPCPGSSLEVSQGNGAISALIISFSKQVTNKV